MDALLTPALQDGLATALAAAALAVLVRRIARMFLASEDAPACEGCSACPTPEEPGDPNSPVPLTFLRRDPSSGRHGSR